MIVLDTNVLSELMSPRPAENVAVWLAAQAGTSVYTTSITQAEILYGLALLPSGKRRRALERAAEEMFRDVFAGRILGFGSDAAPLYARIASARRAAGRPVSHLDAQIAAIALSVGATIATRNVPDFDGCGVRLVDPWRA
jgi:hypothetical protein